MRRVDWTYELPALAADAAGLEDYAVESAVGEPLGKVKTVVRRDGDIYVAVESGVPPLARRIWAVPWEEVEDVDHDSLILRLGVRDDELHRFPQLDVEKGVREGGADAVRVTEIPGGEPRAASPEAPGPVDRPIYLVALGVGLLGVFSALLTVVVIATTESNWRFALIAVPVALLAAGGILAYRFFRRPTESL